MSEQEQKPENEVEKGVKEKETSHKKKSNAVVIGLTGIVAVALVFSSWKSLSDKEARKEAQEAAAAKREAAALGEKKATSIDAFAQAQEEAARAETERAKLNGKENERENMLKKLRDIGGTKEAGDGEQTTSEAESEESILRAQHLADLKKGVSTRGGIGHKRIADASEPVGNVPVQGAPNRSNGAPATMDISAKIREIEAKTAEIEAKKNALMNGGAAPQAYASPALAQQNQVQPKTTSYPNQSFGELAASRVAANPASGGARQGESVLVTGTILHAVTDFDMISDYPGTINATVSRPVYDKTMDNILIPAGSTIVLKGIRVTGTNEVIQNRMAILPQWIIRPDSKRIDLKRTVGMDTAGVAALQDIVDRHILAQMAGVAGYAILGLGPSMKEYGAEPQGSKDTFIKEATGQVRTIGNAAAQKYLNIVPTQRIRAGTQIKIYIEDDIFLTPWEPVNVEHFRRAK